jgi:hypothetical protein
VYPGILGLLERRHQTEPPHQQGFARVRSPPAVKPAMHPRMATEQEGPTPTKQLESPGFMAPNYGRRTPITVILSHIVYGAILGAFYRLK